ncbi:hypothetical protein ACVW2K_000352 [Nocardioides sp. HB32]
MPSNSSKQKQDQRRRAAQRRQGWTEEKIVAVEALRSGESVAVVLERLESGADPAAAQALFDRMDKSARLATEHPPAPVVPQARVVWIPRPGPRRWLGLCWGCEQELWVQSTRPRVPLCEECWATRRRRKGAAA